MKKDGGERGGTGEGVSFCAVLSLVYRGPELTLDHDSFRRVCVKDVVCEGGLVLDWLLVLDKTRNLCVDVLQVQVAGEGGESAFLERSSLFLGAT